MDQRKLVKILRDDIIHLIALIAVGVVLYWVDSSLTRPLWLYIFEMSDDEANWLSKGMAVIYLILAYAASHLLVRKRTSLFIIAITIFLCLNIFSFFGQEVAMDMDGRDPWDFDNNETATDEGSIQSFRHWISTGLTIVLFACAVFIDYLIAYSREAVKGLRKQFSMSSLLRWFDFQIKVLSGFLKRSEGKPTQIAETKVNRRLEDGQNLIGECKSKIQRLKDEESYQLQLNEQMYQQRTAIIEAVYATNKPSFFKSLFR